jgi:formylmethanofuran dehydrogenase subunit E
MNKAFEAWFNECHAIRVLEPQVEPVTCDNCGELRPCKAYPLNEGNAILCQQCWQLEYKFQTSDVNGYSICDNSPNAHKRNQHLWCATGWYGLEVKI